MNTKSQILKSLIREEVRKQIKSRKRLTEGTLYSEGDSIILQDGVTTKQAEQTIKDSYPNTGKALPALLMDMGVDVLEVRLLLRAMSLNAEETIKLPCYLVEPLNQWVTEKQIKSKQ